MTLVAGLFLDPLCPGAPHCFSYATVFPNLAAVAQYQPGLVLFSTAEENEPCLKRVLGGLIGVTVLSFTIFTHLVIADFDNDETVDVAVLDGISMEIGVYSGAQAALLPAVPAQGSAAKPPNKLINLNGKKACFSGIGPSSSSGWKPRLFPEHGRTATKVKLGRSR